jgi:hypothetical protein
MSSTINFKVFPKQKIPDFQKTEQWGRDCVDSGEGMVLIQNQYTRSSRYHKMINFDLYAGKMHPSDIETILNPIGLKDIEFPAKVENHPISNPYIKSLVGEEFDRRFDYKLRVENEDAISEKEKAKKEILNQVIQEILLEGLEQPQVDPNTSQGRQVQEQFQQEVEKRLREKNEYLNYEWQDIRELAGSFLLKYYQDKEEVKDKTNKGWEDALLVAEEIYNVDVIANEPVVTKCNTQNTYFLLPPDSHKVEDADMIVEEKYLPLSAVIDNWYEYLTPKEIDLLETKTGFKNKSNYGGNIGYELQDPLFAIPLGAVSGINVNQINTGSTNFMPFDVQNNIRVVKVVWRSLRRVGILSFLDNKGDYQKKLVHELYEIDKSKGETIEYKWIGEWWEGTKIANEIYVKIQPRPVQFRQLNNLSKCASGYVGTVYKTNSSFPQSLFDMMKPYQYFYNAVYHRLKMMLANNIGKVLKLDLARVPDNWDPDKWLYYAKTMNIAVVDSFKEAKKGAATGKLAAQFSDTQEVLDLELGNSMQSMIMILENIKQELDLITGISPQRRGQIKQDAGLGVTQEAQQASSTITEWYFRMHESTKVRLLATLLETAKYCLRNGNKTIQYIADDMTTQIYTVDGELVNEAEYGLVLRNSQADANAIDMLRKATEIALQTGQVDLIQLMDIYSNQSLSSIRRKIEKSIAKTKEEATQQQQSEQQNAMELQQQAIQVQQQEMEAKYALEYEKLNREDERLRQELETKIYIEEMKSLAFDEGPNGPDILETAKHSLEQLRSNYDQINKNRELDIKNRELNLKNKQHEDTIKVERENMANDIQVEKIRARNRAKSK